MQMFCIIHSKVVIRVSSFVFFFPEKIFGFRISFWRGASKRQESWSYLVLINKQYVVSTFSLIFFFVFLGRKRKSLVGNITRGGACFI